MSETLFFEKKTAGFAVSMKELAGDSGDGWEIAGYASVFGPPPDAVGDVILPTAYNDSLKIRPSVPILWQHQADEIIGKTVFMAPDSTGLIFRAKLDPTRRGIDAQILTSSGTLTGLSIGYNAESEPSRQPGIKRVLTRVDLYEISLVTWPAAERARLFGNGPIKQALLDSLLIAEVDFETKAGRRVPRGKMLACIEAHERVLERMQFSGMTQQQFLDQISAELRELEKLQAAV